MAVVVANVGEIELLNKMLKAALSIDEGYTLKLFKNDYTPVAGSVAGDFTECDFTGYSAKSLTRAGWNSASTVSGKASSIYSAAQSWTCGASGNSVYGYYVIGATSGTLLWAERFPQVKNATNGDTFSVTPSLTLNSEN